MTFVSCRSLVNAKSFHRFAKRYINVLGIESSCDDTSAAIVQDSGHVLGEGHFSQARFHAEAGGIIPIIACNLHRQHIKNVVDVAVNQSRLNIKDLDAIAVTVKPGLVLSLKTGLEYAKDLCSLYSKPLIPIHHMEAHALTARLVEDVRFPYLTFLISGGHCLLALVESVDKFYSLGTSIDNSPGHALDRIARRAKLKNLKQFRGMVGGAAIEAAAVGGDSSIHVNHILRLHGRNCDFSFCSFITSSARFIKEQETKYNLGPDEVIPNIKDLCAGILFGMAKHFCQRIEIAFNYVHIKQLLKESEKCLVMSGGVASNQFFRKAVKMVCDHYNYKFVVPPPELCTDNGIMVAWNAIEKLKQGFPVVQPDNLSSVTELTKKVKCPLGKDISEDVKRVGKTMVFKYMKLKSYLEVANSNESLKKDEEKLSKSS